MMRGISQNICVWRSPGGGRHAEIAYQSPAISPELRSNNRVSVCEADNFRENCSENTLRNG